MKSDSRLERLLDDGQFVVTAECGPPRGADPDIIRKKGELLKGYVDAVNVTDNQTAIARMSSIAAGAILVQEGLEPIIQMTCRDRNRLAIQSDLLGAAALGIQNLLCLFSFQWIAGQRVLGCNSISSKAALQVIRLNQSF